MVAGQGCDRQWRADHDRISYLPVCLRWSRPAVPRSNHRVRPLDRGRHVGVSGLHLSGTSCRRRPAGGMAVARRARLDSAPHGPHPRWHAADPARSDLLPACRPRPGTARDLHPRLRCRPQPAPELVVLDRGALAARQGICGAGADAPRPRQVGGHQRRGEFRAGAQWQRHRFFGRDRRSRRGSGIGDRLWPPIARRDGRDRCCSPASRAAAFSPCTMPASSPPRSWP